MNRNTLLVFSFLVSFSFYVIASDDFVRKFDDFKKKYNKNYDSTELNLRYENFKASIERSERRNENSKSAVYGVTKFSDLSTEEFKSIILMKNTISPKSPESSQIIRSKVPSVPEFFDWRQQGAVTAVKNQEQCGSCWAFSATENVESMWILAGKGNSSSVDFSPQQIVDCDESDDGCEGGEPETAYDYLISAGGIESEKSYPYTGEDGTCDFNAKEVVGKISTWQYATEWLDESLLQLNLLALGPLSVCVDAEAWQDYEGGVMTWEDCAYVNILDHCVQLVGYNSTDSNNPYWMVRNSWGTDWGIDGYIWLQMWEDTCGITYEATCVTI